MTLCIHVRDVLFFFFSFLAHAHLTLSIARKNVSLSKVRALPLDVAGRTQWPLSINGILFGLHFSKKGLS